MNIGSIDIKKLLGREVNRAVEKVLESYLNSDENSEERRKQKTKCFWSQSNADFELKA